MNFIDQIIFIELISYSCTYIVTNRINRIDCLCNKFSTDRKYNREPSNSIVDILF